MALEALFHRDDGTRNVPGVDSGWEAWVSASRTRYHLLGDPLLDWLGAHGESKGFQRDDRLPGYDARTDFGPFILRKGNDFEAAVVRHLSACTRLTTIAADRAEARTQVGVRRTWEALCAGAEAIAQAPIWNPETQTFGVIDLLVRSDVLDRLFPHLLKDATHPAPDLPNARWHYRVLDIKFSTLHLLKDGHCGSKHLHYGAQVWLYNAAVGRLQGWTPPNAFLLGRGWEGARGRGHSALDRLSRVDHGFEIKKVGERLGDRSLAACEWIRRVRSSGKQWDVLPAPSVPELRPNMRFGEDAPWHQAKKRIAEELQDLTILPRVNPEMRDAGIAAGLTGWKDPRCSAALLGVTGPKLVPLVDAVIAANHASVTDPPVRCPRITVNESLWRNPAPVEFYVDFETVTDLDDDFSTFPKRGGQPLIFMVGLGYVDAAKEWRFESFVVDRLVLEEERRILTAWIDRMRALCVGAACEFEACRMFHWSPAEVSFLETAYNSAAERHGLPEWRALPWVDLLGKVVREQPVTVRGAFGFGLKAVTKAMHAAGLIAADWPDGVADGMGAMVGAWWCDGEARRTGVSMSRLDLMRQIEAYNRVDVEAMRDVLDWLRRNR